jgi:plastocyanin
MMPKRLLVAAGILLATPGVPARAATVEITMENLEIVPHEVSAKVGDTVTWVNKDVFAHTATANNGDFDVSLPAKKTGSLVLMKSGTVDYYCRFHPNMKATLKIAP